MNLHISTSLHVYIIFTTSALWLHLLLWLEMRDIFSMFFVFARKFPNNPELEHFSEQNPFGNCLKKGELK